jgi:hypothetical protein
VTWELDIPPVNLLEPARKTPPASEVPTLDQLRASLLGTRFELLKISTFAAFLLAFVGVAIHGSHLANPDNQFAANTGAAIQGLAKALSNQTASLRGDTEALALAAAQKAQATIGHATGTPRTATPSSPATIAQADLPAVVHTGHAAQVVHRKAHAAPPALVQTSSLEPHHSQRERHRHAPVVMAAAKMPVEVPDPQWSGNLLDLPDFVLAEGSRAGYRILDAMQGGLELCGLPRLRSKGEGAMNSLGNHFDVTNPDGVALHDPSSMFEGLVSPDSLVAAITALFLYMIFVVVLVHIKGGLRASGGSHAV